MKFVPVKPHILALSGISPFQDFSSASHKKTKNLVSYKKALLSLSNKKEKIFPVEMTNLNSRRRVMSVAPLCRLVVLSSSSC